MIVKMENTITKWRFASVVLRRAVRILFSRNKQIKLLTLEYPKQYIFRNSYVVFRYSFRNVLWLSFGGHRTTNPEFAVFNLPNLPTDFSLTAYGLFRRNHYTIRLRPSLEFDSTRFSTSVHSTKVEVSPQQLKSVGNPGPEIRITPIRPVSATPVANFPEVTFLPAMYYNQNDFI